MCGVWPLITRHDWSPICSLWTRSTTELTTDSTVRIPKNGKEAAVDVPNLLKDNSSVAITAVISHSGAAVTETSPKVTAPLAQVEAYEEKHVQQEQMQVAAATSLKSAVVPIPTAGKQNGQAVVEQSIVLETSIDESMTYEPNRTFEDSDEEDRPCLDEQIQKLEQELITPKMQKDLNLGPAPEEKTVKPAADSASSGKSSGVATCMKTMLVSVSVTLLLSSVLFYVVFFSPLKSHPMASRVRDHVEFLEPVRDIVQKQVDEAMKFLKK